MDDLTNEHSLAARSSSKQLQCLDSLDSPQGGGVSTVALGAQTFLFGTGASGQALAGGGFKLLHRGRRLRGQGNPKI